MPSLLRGVRPLAQHASHPLETPRRSPSKRESRTVSLTPADNVSVLPSSTCASMMAPTLLSERVHFAGNVFCMPITLLINFALFQYLMGMFYSRRREPRIFLLLVCAFVGFAVIIPFSHPDRRVYVHLDKVSEMCSAMTFLIQITIIGRDINKKMRIKSLRYLTYVGELLTWLGVLLAIAEFIQAVIPGAQSSIIDTIDDIMEDVSLVFIFFFRFYFIAMSKGFKATISERKLEIFLYALFVTHSYPFVILHSYTKADWEPVQAMWNRFTLLLCILHTVKEKIRATRSSVGRGLSGRSQKSKKSLQTGAYGTGGASSGASASAAGQTALAIKANSIRSGLAARLPTWRSGNFSAVRPELGPPAFQ